jgi:hypothetical protein
MEIEREPFFIYKSIRKLKKISDYKEFLSKCGYFVKDISFNKSFFKDVLQGKKKLLKKTKYVFLKENFLDSENYLEKIYELELNILNWLYTFQIIL